MEGQTLSTHSGFLFKTKEGKWVLSQEPNLKTCCIGSKHKASTQIFLEGDFSGIKDNTLIKVKGVLQTNTDTKILAHAEVVKNSQSHTPLYSLGFAGLALVSFVLFKKFSKR
jgi:hypothetical protein